jgi:MFS transporter, PAT family, solute carrier family 33 (acetyl-CoA transportor), member 1
MQELALMSPVLVGLGMVIPLAVGKLTAGPRPLDIFLTGYPLRILVTIAYAGVLPLAKYVYSDEYTTAAAVDASGGSSASSETAAVKRQFYYALIGAVVLHEIATNFMYVSMMAFFARVSDPAIGGTYMTLLNTVANLGSKW